jgi:hypothetical protein
MMTSVVEPPSSSASSLRVRLATTTATIEFASATLSDVTVDQCRRAVVAALQLSPAQAARLRLTRPFPPPAQLVVDVDDDAATPLVARCLVAPRDVLVAELLSETKPRIRASAGTLASTVEEKRAESPARTRRKRMRLSELGRGRRLGDGDDDDAVAVDQPQDQLGSMLVAAAGKDDDWSAKDRVLLADLRADLARARRAFHLEVLSDARVASALSGLVAFEQQLDGKWNVLFGQKQRRERAPVDTEADVIDVDAEAELVFVHEHVDRDVPLVPTFLLKMVLLQVVAAEGIAAISPHSMASKSLRCFWSIVKSCQIGPSMPFSVAMLQLLPPAIADEHSDTIRRFDVRSRKLSEKALRNLEPH